ncbi:MAG: quinol:cytochrome C oxidoreductase, partial [Flavobacteriaceae bacterium]
PKVNDSHIHDLAKFMFGFSVFWTYLWFAQFMLIWYADIPEETTYFVLRFTEYKTLFLSMLVMNFVFPVLLLINSDFKSRPWFVVIGGIVILAGHYVDLFIMIMPGTVGGSWSFGIPEISATFFFLGVFIYTVFSAFAKADPVPKGNPFLHESEHFHYFNIEHHSEEDNQH